MKSLTRMTRDFEIVFNNEVDKNAKKILTDITLKKDKVKIFGEIEDRNKSLFVTLNYPHEIKNDYLVVSNKLELNFSEVVLLQLKMVCMTQGYVFYSPNSEQKIPSKPIHISQLHDFILSHF